MYEYRCKVVHVVDGDTVDVDIDLGFGVWLRNERVRLVGVDAPESRTSDDIERIFGNLAKTRVLELCSNDNLVLKSEAFKGKFGRILGDIIIDGESLTSYLLKEHLAVQYKGQSKEEIKELHLINREILISEGKVHV